MEREREWTGYMPEAEDSTFNELGEGKNTASSPPLLPERSIFPSRVAGLVWIYLTLNRKVKYFT